MLLLHLFVYISPCSVKKKSEVGKQFTNCKILWDVIFNPWKSLNFEPQGSLEIGGFGTFYILQWLVSWPKLVAQQATEHKFPSHYITSFQEIKKTFFPPLEKRWCLLHWFDSLVLYLLILLSPFSVHKVEITWILPQFLSCCPLPHTTQTPNCEIICFKQPPVFCTWLTLIEIRCQLSGPFPLGHSFLFFPPQLTLKLNV